MTDGPCLQLPPTPDHTCTPDLHNLRAWLELQSLNTLAEIMAEILEELRQRRAAATTTTTIPISRDFGGIGEED